MNSIYRKINYKVLIIAVLGSGFIACRDYKSLAKVPDQNLKGIVRDAAVNETDTASLSNVPWKEYFPDAKLQSLIEEGLRNNYDMKLAMSRINQADIALTMTKGAMLPTLSAGLNVDHTRFSHGARGEDVLGYYSNVISLGFAATWEADLWGKLSSQTKAKYAAYLQTQQYRYLVQTTMVSTLAQSYYSLLALDEQLRVTKETIVLLQKSTETMQALKDAGQQTQAAVEQSNALLYNTQLSVYDLQNKISQQENAIAILVGRNPGPIDRGSINDLQVPGSMNDEIPLKALARRPDVKQAELSLQSAYALTDAAKAAFYPTLSIGSSSGPVTLGVGAGTFSDLFKPQSIAAEIVAGLAQPIFYKKQLKGNLKLMQAQQADALLSFSHTLSLAGQEVSNIMYTYKMSVNKNDWRDKQVKSLTNAVDYTQELLKAGEASYTEVLSAQKDLLSAQLGKVNDKLEQLIQSVNLYKALGGGIK